MEVHVWSVTISDQMYVGIKSFTDMLCKNFPYLNYFPINAHFLTNLHCLNFGIYPYGVRALHFHFLPARVLTF